MTLPEDTGALSIDFLIGFTIFILAFIWVATMIPGMLVGLNANNIDYDAVAYRTGVILTEDPGWPEIPAWESKTDGEKYDITRFGLAIRKDSPNLLSQNKIDRFFNVSTTDPNAGFIYPDDYQPRVIFGDYPYKFNITLRDVQRDKIYSVGEILPEDFGDGESRLNEYGYIRRLVKIKSTGNATVNVSEKRNFYLNTTMSNQNNVTTHTFSILLNISRLKGGIEDPVHPVDASRAHDPAYIIDPTRDLTIINVTNINKTLNIDQRTSTTIHLMNISMNYLDPSSRTMTKVRNLYDMEIDGFPKSSTEYIYDDPNGFPVKDDISLVLQPTDIGAVSGLSNNPVYLNMTFELSNPSAFLNNSFSKPFDYNYDPTNVTQSTLHDGILEVAIW